MPKLVVARNAMATRFEIVLEGENERHLRAAAEEALEEVARCEELLSLYRHTSEINHINTRAALEPVRVSPRVFRLLQRALELSALTDGAFDITVAPLMRCWGFMRDSGRMAEPQEVAAARELVGCDKVILDPTHFSVQLARPGMMLDLGALGKGFALDAAAEILRDAEITSALLHGGTSTAIAFGKPADAEAWKIAVDFPADTPTKPQQPARVFELHDAALSVSAASGKSFMHEGTRYGHVLDPRTGAPAQSAMLATVLSRSAADSDALSTALLTLGPAGEHEIRAVPGVLDCFVI